MNSPRHVPFVILEIEADDLPRASGFYARLLGWEFAQSTWEQGALEAHLLEDHDTTVRVHLRQRAPAPVPIRTRADVPRHGLVLCVRDLARVVDAVAPAGGRLLDGPEEVPGLGRRVRFLDTEGNHVAVLEPLHPPAA